MPIDHSILPITSFPAPCGPASLKGRRRLRELRRRHRFSGPLRAGLIEGQLAVGARRRDDDEFSGPLRAGLIEGLSTAVAVAPQRLVFRPLAGRPH